MQRFLQYSKQIKYYSVSTVICDFKYLRKEGREIVGNLNMLYIVLCGSKKLNGKRIEKCWEKLENVRKQENENK